MTQTEESWVNNLLVIITKHDKAIDDKIIVYSTVYPECPCKDFNAWIEYIHKQCHNLKK